MRHPSFAPENFVALALEFAFRVLLLHFNRVTLKRVKYHPAATLATVSCLQSSTSRLQRLFRPELQLHAAAASASQAMWKVLPPICPPRESPPIRVSHASKLRSDGEPSNETDRLCTPTDDSRRMKPAPLNHTTPGSIDSSATPSSTTKGGRKRRPKSVPILGSTTPGWRKRSLAQQQEVERLVQDAVDRMLAGYPEDQEEEVLDCIVLRGGVLRRPQQAINSPPESTVLQEQQTNSVPLPEPESEPPSRKRIKLSKPTKIAPQLNRDRQRGAVRRQSSPLPRKIAARVTTDVHAPLADEEDGDDTPMLDSITVPAEMDLGSEKQGLEPFTVAKHAGSSNDTNTPVSMTTYLKDLETRLEKSRLLEVGSKTRVGSKTKETPAKTMESSRPRTPNTSNSKTSEKPSEKWKCMISPSGAKLLKGTSIPLKIPSPLGPSPRSRRRKNPPRSGVKPTLDRSGSGTPDEDESLLQPYRPMSGDNLLNKESPIKEKTNDSIEAVETPIDSTLKAKVSERAEKTPVPTSTTVPAKSPVPTQETVPPKSPVLTQAPVLTEAPVENISNDGAKVEAASAISKTAVEVEIVEVTDTQYGGDMLVDVDTGVAASTSLQDMETPAPSAAAVPIETSISIPVQEEEAVAGMTVTAPIITAASPLLTPMDIHTPPPSDSEILAIKIAESAAPALPEVVDAPNCASAAAHSPVSAAVPILSTPASPKRLATADAPPQPSPVTTATADSLLSAPVSAVCTTTPVPKFCKQPSIFNVSLDGTAFITPSPALATTAPSVPSTVAITPTLAPSAETNERNHESAEGPLNVAIASGDDSPEKEDVNMGNIDADADILLRAAGGFMYETASSASAPRYPSPEKAKPMKAIRKSIGPKTTKSKKTEARKSLMVKLRVKSTTPPSIGAKQPAPSPIVDKPTPITQPTPTAMIKHSGFTPVNAPQSTLVNSPKPAIVDIPRPQPYRRPDPGFNFQVGRSIVQPKPAIAAMMRPAVDMPPAGRLQSLSRPQPSSYPSPSRSQTAASANILGPIPRPIPRLQPVSMPQLPPPPPVGSMFTPVNTQRRQQQPPPPPPAEPQRVPAFSRPQSSTPIMGIFPPVNTQRQQPPPAAKAEPQQSQRPPAFSRPQSSTPTMSAPKPHATVEPLAPASNFLNSKPDELQRKSSSRESSTGGSLGLPTLERTASPTEPLRFLPPLPPLPPSEITFNIHCEHEPAVKLCIRGSDVASPRDPSMLAWNLLRDIINRSGLPFDDFVQSLVVNWVLIIEDQETLARHMTDFRRENSVVICNIDTLNGRPTNPAVLDRMKRERRAVRERIGFDDD